MKRIVSARIITKSGFRKDIDVIELLPTIDVPNYTEPTIATYDNEVPLNYGKRFVLERIETVGIYKEI